MADRGTRKTTTDRLEEALARLTLHPDLMAETHWDGSLRSLSFFYYQATPEEERITLASFYLDGPALSWFQWSYRNEFITSW